MPILVSELAQQLGGDVVGDGTVQITGVASADQAGPGDLTFAEQEGYFKAAEQSQASAILVAHDFAASSKTLIRVSNARIAMAKALALLFPAEEPQPGIHPTAVLAESARVDASAQIGPHCVIGEGVTVGPRCLLHGGNHVRAHSTLGEAVVLHPNVVIYPGTRIGNRVIIHSGTAIGTDGYGYVFDEGHHRKILQVGHVEIADDVEIGSNTCVDRGALGPTVIGQGTKLDNLVQVAHNVVMGNHCLVMGQCGFAGSTALGDYCVIASQTGVADHLKLGAGVTVGAKSGVMKDLPPQSTVLGVPAIPDKQFKRQVIATQQLPELIRRLRRAERELAELKTSLGK
jgi:UDP-3-O-[3-hydroxymyristoyl] glucosamine N-acyltransferase